MDQNYYIAMQYRNIPLTLEKYNVIKDSINCSCRHYILGRAYAAEKEHLLKTGGKFTDFGSKYGYSTSGATRFVSYANAIDKLHNISPELAIDIIEEKIWLSMDNTIIISRKEPDEVFKIVERLSDKSVKVSDIFPTYNSKTQKKFTFATNCRV